jgi:hypothetical protein
VSNLYKDLKNRDILQEPVVEVTGMKCTPYLIIDSTYAIHIFLQNNWRSPQDEDKKRYDSAMNLGRVVIENIFGTLKNKRQILKHLNSKVDRAPKITITCCWLHNYCELWNQPKPRVS